MKYLILKGGLGNQLFQFAAFLYLKDKEFFDDIKIDYRTGFFLDYKYRRNLEISSLLKSKYSCSIYISIINTIFLCINKFIPIPEKILPFKIIKDTNLQKLLENKKDLKNKFLLFDGYFQNSFLVEKILHNLKKFIRNDLEAKEGKRFDSLYKEIKNNENSVALCIRFYEESVDPNKHSDKNNGFKTIDQFNKVIYEIESKLESPFFYIFVQKENGFTKKLRFNSDVKFITHSKGYRGSWSRLKAQSTADIIFLITLLFTIGARNYPLITIKNQI